MVVAADDTVGRALRARAPHDERRARCRKFIEHVFAVALPEDDEAVGTPRPEYVLERIGIVVIRRTQQEILVPVTERFGDAREQIEHERVRDVSLLV